jgi:hypothetical protein
MIYDRNQPGYKKDKAIRDKHEKANPEKDHIDFPEYAGNRGGGAKGKHGPNSYIDSPDPHSQSWSSFSIVAVAYCHCPQKDDFVIDTAAFTWNSTTHKAKLPDSSYPNANKGKHDGEIIPGVPTNYEVNKAVKDWKDKFGSKYHK